MGLRNHFHPPLKNRRHWHSFHNGWAYSIAEDLNQRLPEAYFAESNVQFEVAMFQEDEHKSPSFSWHPPAPTKTLPYVVLTNVVQVQLYEMSAGPTLVGAIEIVSPANKDRASHRQAFTSKCETFLQQGIGLVIIDIVTNRHANLHNELLDDEWNANLYSTAYRTLYQPDDQPSLDIWQIELKLNETLPTMPLWLRGGLCVPIDLNTTYERTCRAHRIS